MGRPDVNIVSAFGREITAGTPVPANRIVPTISWNPKIKRETKQFRAQGKKYSTSSVRHKQHSDGGYDGVLDYNSFIYVLNGLTVPVVVPSNIGGSTLGKLWSYRPLSRAQDNPHTYTFEVGDETAVDRYAYGQLSSLTADLGQDDMKLSGNLFARTMTPNLTQGGSANEIQSIAISATSGSWKFAYSGQTSLSVPYNVTAEQLYAYLILLSNIGAGDVIVTGGPGATSPLLIEFTGSLASTNVAAITTDATNGGSGGLAGGGSSATVTTIQAGAAAATVTEIPERPVERGQINVYLDNTYGGIGGTQITDAFEEQLQLGEKFKPKFVHNRNCQSFKEAIEVAPSLVFSFMTEHNSQSRAILADVISNDTLHYLRIEAAGLDLSDAQDDSVTELIRFDLAGKFTDAEEIKDSAGSGTYGYRYHFVALDDPNGMGRPWRVDIQNTRPSL